MINTETETAGTPLIGVYVTADIHVSRYDSSSSLDEVDKSRKCTIVTSLNAIIKKSSSTGVEVKVPHKNEYESRSNKLQTPLSKETFDHPLIRKSKKRTQLNHENLVRNVSFYKRTQIDRTVLLPYLGCTSQYESVKSFKKIIVKSSKSWETINNVVDRFDKVKPFHSQTFLSESSKSKTSARTHLSGIKKVVLKNAFTKEYELVNHATSPQPVRRFYLIKNCSSSLGISENERTNMNNVKRQFNQANNKSLELNPKYSTRNLHSNIAGFEEEIFGPLPEFCSKTTRNVSTLHRPKTRDKATSTTSLYKMSSGQDQDSLMQGLLMPYISIGGDFPSEIVLKLVPKKDALQSCTKDNPDGDVKSTNSSELNLLAPTLNAVTLTKKKKRNGFLSCFPFNKKNKDDSNGSSGGSNTSNDSKKEIYFPSIVEVHNKKSRKLPKDVDFETDTIDSVIHVEKKKKRT